MNLNKIINFEIFDFGLFTDIYNLNRLHMIDLKDTIKEDLIFLNNEVEILEEKLEYMREKLKLVSILGLQINLEDHIENINELLITYNREPIIDYNLDKIEKIINNIKFIDIEYNERISIYVESQYNNFEIDFDSIENDVENNIKNVLGDKTVEISVPETILILNLILNFASLHDIEKLLEGLISYEDNKYVNII